MRAVVILASIMVIGAGAWLLGPPHTAPPSTPAFPIAWPALLFGGLLVALLLVIAFHSMHEQRAISRAVADALRDRAPLTDEEFGKRFYNPNIAPVASRLRRLLAEDLNCDLSGMIPSDDFEEWLNLFPGPDSAADTFYEEMAIDFQLARDCPWPERFRSFDSLVRFVTEHARAPKPC